MNFKHVKSPCCGAKIRHFGGRRRQCGNCKKTWSIRPQKRGRPQYRLATDRLGKVFLNNFSVKQLFSCRVEVKLGGYYYRFRQHLRKLVAKPYTPQIPEGPLILLADGVWFKFDGKPWVLYLTALKPCSGKHAVFLRPYLIQGKEGGVKWQRIFSQIPEDIKRRTCALVVDNFNGMQAYARENNWLIQLCQFHLLAKLKVKRDIKQRTLKGGAGRIEIYELISYALHAKDPQRLNEVLTRLEFFSKGDVVTKRIRATVRDFLSCSAYYRTYLDYPNLNLHTTTNTMESMNSLLKALLRHSRAGTTSNSLLMWSEALIRSKKQLACRNQLSTEFP